MDLGYPGREEGGEYWTHDPRMLWCHAAAAKKVALWDVEEPGLERRLPAGVNADEEKPEHQVRG
ncbi:hypothetical protein MKX08_005924 [Trichoderma sp. CBMAI-0020]|nr:hypothetical protein MKX08_005924 [Trichoderma sp. CBMAI-0020]